MVNIQYENTHKSLLCNIVFLLYIIYLIRYFDYHRNKASIEQIYNITAYTDI